MPFELRTVETLIASVSELVDSDLDLVGVLGNGGEGIVSTTRIKHHKIAQLAACGISGVEIAEIMGYGVQYIYTLLKSPAVQGLVGEYIKSNWAEVENVTRRARLAAASGLEELHRRIEQEPKKIPFKELTNATLGLLDRGGIAQRHAVVHFGLTPEDIAGILKKANEDDDTRLVEAESAGSGAEVGGSNGGVAVELKRDSEGIWS